MGIALRSGTHGPRDGVPYSKPSFTSELSNMASQSLYSGASKSATSPSFAQRVHTVGSISSSTSSTMSTTSFFEKNRRSVASASSLDVATVCACAQMDASVSAATAATPTRLHSSEGIGVGVWGHWLVLLVQLTRALSSVRCAVLACVAHSPP